MKLLFDENIGKPLAQAIGQILRFDNSRHEVRHILDLTNKLAVPDEQWVPTIADGDWMVITADRGRQGPGRPLPRICKELSVTHVVISGTLHNSRQFEKARAIIALWPEFIRAFDGPKGVEYRLQMGPRLVQQGALG